jgi:hypothetical protein
LAPIAVYPNKTRRGKIALINVADGFKGDNEHLMKNFPHQIKFISKVGCNFFSSSFFSALYRHHPSSLFL